MDEEEVKKAQKLAKRVLKDEIISMAILKRADKLRYGNLHINLKNDYVLGNNNYPMTPAAVLKVVNNYKPEWTG